MPPVLRLVEKGPDDVDFESALVLEPEGVGVGEGDSANAARSCQDEANRRGRASDGCIPLLVDDEASARTISESSSGSHLGHARADTAGDNDSRATAKWPADTGTFMMERETVVVGVAWERPGTTTPRAPSPRATRPPTGNNHSIRPRKFLFDAGEFGLW
jgi:hypothetical protein